MGGYGSGRQYGAPLAEECLRVDLPWMIQNDRAMPGFNRGGTLSWNCRGQPSGSISYQANMIDPDDAWLILTYTRGTGDKAEKVRQEIRLTTTKQYSLWGAYLGA